MKRPLVIAILGVFIVLFATLLAFFAFEDDRGGGDSSADPSTAVPETTTAPGDEDRKESQSSSPAFDVVRIDPAGNAVVAGTAQPGAKVTILDGENPLGIVSANDDGEWVFVPEEPLQSGSRELSLSAANPDGATTKSKDVVVLVAPNGESGKPLVVKTARGGGPTTVLQGNRPLSGEIAVSVDTVDYGPDGALTVGGRAKNGKRAAVYVDNVLVGSTSVDQNTHWRVTPQIKATEGNHVLRVDLLDDAGTVLTRLEQPFSRVELASMPAGTRVVVQPGNSLWILARRAYGKGRAYTVIFDANKGQIKDPDLIYPGQVFVLPEG